MVNKYWDLNEISWYDPTPIIECYGVVVIE